MTRTERDHLDPGTLAVAEQDAWQKLGAIMIKLPAVLDAALQPDGLTHLEYLSLAGLAAAPEGTRRMSDLAVLANGSVSRLSNVLKRLERSGWVRREPDPADGRFTRVILTADGREKFGASTPNYVSTIRSLMVEPLRADQVGQLQDIADRILRRMDPDDTNVPDIAPVAESAQD